VRWKGDLACVVGIESAYKILAEKHKGKRPEGRREENIKIDDKESCFRCEHE
jgi:hypothetical protein